MARSKKECLKELYKVLPKVNRKNAEAIADDIDNIRNKSNSNAEFTRRVNEYFKTTTREARVRIEGNMRTAAIVDDEIARINETFKTNIQEGLRGIFAPSDFKARGSKTSIHTEHIVLADRIKNMLKRDLDKKHLKLAESGKLDREIRIAKYQMANNQKVTVSDPARKIAEAITKGYNEMHRVMKMSGSSRGYIDGYMKRVYDATKLPSTFKEFKKLIEPHIHKEKTFKYQSDDSEFIDSVLKDMYEGIINDEINPTSVSDINSKYVELKTVGALDKRTSKSRTIHFKNGEAEHAVMSKIGKGNVFSNFSAAMEGDARVAATLNRLGPNHTQAWEAIKSGVFKNLTPEQAKKIDVKKLDDLFKNTTSGFQIGRKWQSKATTAARNLTLMSNLGSVVRTIIPMDFASTFLNTMSTTGKNPFKAFNDTLRFNLKSMTKKQRQQTAKALKIYTDNYLGTFYSRVSSDERELGAMSKIMDGFFKINFAEFSTDVTRSAGYALHAFDVASHKSIDFDRLPKKFKRTIESYGIDSQDWQVIRQSVENVNGNDMVSLDVLDNLDISPEMKHSIGLKLSKFLKNETEHTSVPMADVYDESFVKRRFDPDSPMGVAAQSIGMFWPIAIRGGRIAMQKALDLGGSDARSLKEAFQDRSFYKGLSQVMVTLTVAGAISEMADDLFENKQSDLSDPAFYNRALIKGGALGLYGDFLLAEYDKRYRSFPEDLAGPVAQTVGDFASLTHKVWHNAMTSERREKIPNLEAKALRTMWNNAPGTDLIYLKGVLDYYIYDEWMEGLNPGYKRRKRRRERREGQEELF